MIITKTSQVDIKNLEEKRFDLVLASSGYESRSIFLCENYNLNGSKKIAIGFDNHKDQKARELNDVAFCHLGFDIKFASGESELIIFEILDFLLTESKDELNILIDYSCMTRIWYAGVLKFFSNKFFTAKIINVFFCYSFSEFIEPPIKQSFNTNVGPIDGFYQLSIPDRPTSVVIGLGYIESRAFGLAEYFDVEPILLIADSSISSEFYYYVKQNNKELLKSVNAYNIFEYPLENLSYTETLLSHLCESLKSKFRTILAPCGPKPFTLLCLITALRKNDIDVWRISAGTSEVPVDKKPSGKVSAYQVSFMPL